MILGAITRVDPSGTVNPNSSVPHWVLHIITGHRAHSFSLIGNIRPNGGLAQVRGPVLVTPVTR